MSSTPENIQHVEIYLDYATIPTLNYFLHFTENQTDKTTIRLFGLARFNIPQDIIDGYPNGIIQFYSVKGNDQTLFNQAFEKLLREHNGKLKLNLHLNLFHSLNMFIPLFEIYLKYLDKIDRISLYL